MNKIKTLFIKNKIINFKYYKHIFLVSVIYLYAYILLTFINIYAKNLAELELLREENKKCMERRDDKNTELDNHSDRDVDD